MTEESKAILREALLVIYKSVKITAEEFEEIYKSAEALASTIMEGIERRLRDEGIST